MKSCCCYLLLLTSKMEQLIQFSPSFSPGHSRSIFWETRSKQKLIDSNGLTAFLAVGMMERQGEYGIERSDDTKEGVRKVIQTCVEYFDLLFMLLFVNDFNYEKIQLPI